VPVPVIEADRPGTVESLIAVSCMSAVLSCTRFTPRRAANEATAGEILHQ